MSTEGSTSSEDSSTAPSRLPEQDRKPTPHSRQGKKASASAVRSKVAQFPRTLVQDALTRRSRQEREAGENPLWDGKLPCLLCGNAYEAKSLQRHLESHGRQSSRSTWVCCGVPNVNGKHGRKHGCGLKFYHRRDALVRHIKHTRCLGDLAEIQSHIRRAREEKSEVYPGVW